MSQTDDFEDRGARKAHGGPYTGKHPVPTIKGYREHRAEIKNRQDEAGDFDNQQEEETEAGESKTRRAFDSIKAIAKDKDRPKSDARDPYPNSNRNDLTGSPHGDLPYEQSTHDLDDQSSRADHADDSEDASKKKKEEKSGTEKAAASLNPKEKRKAMKKEHKGKARGHGGREVTDPVTHLPITIHDMTDKMLKSAPENQSGFGSVADHRTSTGGGPGSKSREELAREKDEMDSGHEGMRTLFPPPHFEDAKQELMRVYKNALMFGLGGASALGLLVLAAVSFIGPWGFGKWGWTGLGGIAVAWTIAASGILFLLNQTTGWLTMKVDAIFEDETWDSARQQEISSTRSDQEMPESVAWLNSLLASVWPLMNPDLFASIVDTLEDVMQASLPKVVRMVSVDDIGQGSEAFRILGVKWLPTGAANKSVNSDGSLEERNGDNDRAVSGQGETDDSGNGGEVERAGKEKDDKEEEEDQEAIEEGMEAEEGDFVNMELAFSYRARSSGKSLKKKIRNAHLYLKFYLPGGIAVPVWVELRGIVGIMRVRLQLTPDPPFFELCTLTLLGQPRADLSCVPLSKHSLNLMNVPLISSFVQSAIDAALAEYVAPKSLTLDLKDMLVGEDFKKDTLTRGVIMVFVKRARGFKQGDGGLTSSSGSSDSYVTVSWGKFGKTVGSTRIIVGQQEPTWGEWIPVLVSPDEINAEETVRLQIWDSDKYTADDDLGRAEISLKELMHGSKTKNKMCDRVDELRAEDPDEKMPGTLEWSVGFFSKAHIQQCQLDKQTFDPRVRDVKKLKTRVSETAKSKLREANWSQDESDELHQQEAQDLKETEDNMIISAPPPDGLPSGILSIQIHNITGLEVAKLNRDRSHGAGDGEDREDEAEQSDRLPDSYCTIILNHRKIYRTRTKPKNAKPFFNAGTERFVKDWRTAEVIVSVRDSREGETDPLLGVVYLPLRRVFEKRSQVMQTYPLAGGIGYGRARISMVWRSVELQVPRELTGWDYGTLEVKGPVRAKSQLDENLRGSKLKLTTKIGKGKMHPLSNHSSGQEVGEWIPKKKRDDSIFLAVIKRHASSMVMEFYHSSLVSDSNPAIAVLWLSSIPDEEDKVVKLKVWKGGKKQLDRARSCSEYQGLEEGEEPLGEIEMMVRFWRGLSGYHKRYAGKSRNSDVRGVMEVLDLVNDEKMVDDGPELDETDNSRDASDDDESWSEVDHGSGRSGTGEGRQSPEEAEKRKMLRKAGADDSSSSGSSDDESDSESGPIKKLKTKSESALGGKSGDGSDDDGSRGPLAQIQDYKLHHKTLHRKHRGVMQWKAARTLDWMADRARHGKGKVGDVFRHSDKDTGIEREV